MCTGSGYVARRSAIADIGGWPQVEAGEDFMCSALLSDKGWKVAFIRENLQFGLAPSSLNSHIKQRMRWVDSGIEVHKQFGFYVSGSKVRMTLVQRCVGILQVLREYSPLTTVMALIIMPLAFYFSIWHEIIAPLSDTQRHLLRWTFLASFMATAGNKYVLYRHVGLQKACNFLSTDIWCSPCKCF